jgi:hypothetical protein
VRYYHGLDENFQVERYPIIEAGDWVRLKDKGHFPLVEGKIYQVIKDEVEGFGVGNKITIWDDVENRPFQLYVLRFDYVERQGELI